MLKPEIEDGQMSLADPAFRADVLAGLEGHGLVAGLRGGERRRRS